MSYKSPYILGRDGIIHHDILAKLLREKGFDTDRRIDCEPSFSDSRLQTYGEVGIV